jgi:hypothetical protein
MPTGSARTGAGWSRIAKLAPISPVPIATSSARCAGTGNTPAPSSQSVTAA